MLTGVLLCSYRSAVRTNGLRYEFDFKYRVEWHNLTLLSIHHRTVERILLLYGSRVNYAGRQFDVRVLVYLCFLKIVAFCVCISPKTIPCLILSVCYLSYVKQMQVTLASHSPLYASYSSYPRNSWRYRPSRICR